MNLIENINSPNDLKKLSLKELPLYAEDARNFIIDTVNKNGGHLSSNLGSIELTVALHYVFNSPEDKIVWDVGHQAYTHKLITGRRKLMEDLRKNGGASGFPNVNESEHDTFTVGHSSTSLSSALGLARARDLKNEKHNVIAVIGDGALTGGMAYEALNDIGSSKTPLLIILNDNRMSISENVGAMSKYLARLRMSRRYTGFKSAVKKGVTALPFFGDKIFGLLDKIKNIVKNVFVKDKMFEQMGIRYYGPIDGHNIKTLIHSLKNVRRDNHPVILHISTKKGKGMEEAEKCPERFHGVSPPQSDCGESMSAAAGAMLTELARTDKKITAVTAAMCDGTGLKQFCESFSDRFFDVGIAEQHAVTMSAALAKEGFKPYFAVYSSFLQRGFDQIIHDIAIMNLPVKLLIDRAGVIGADGVTHQGVFDIAYLNLIPNMTVLTPADTTELAAMIKLSKDFSSPIAIRYPKSGELLLYGNAETRSKTDLLKWETVRKCEKMCDEIYQENSRNKNNELNNLTADNSDKATEKTYLNSDASVKTKIKSEGDTAFSGKRVCILAAGSRMLALALKTKGTEVVNARSIKPLDIEFLNKINGDFDLIVTMEDGVINGGFGESVLNYLNGIGLKSKVVSLGIEDSLVTDIDTNVVMNRVFNALQAALKTA